MSRRFITSLVAGGAIALGALVPATASAEQYLSKSQAESAAKDAALEKYGAANYGAFCRPQGRGGAARGYSYDRWVCNWADNYQCEGVLKISGARGSGAYYWQVLRGQRCA